MTTLEYKISFQICRDLRGTACGNTVNCTLYAAGRHLPMPVLGGMKKKKTSGHRGIVNKSHIALAAGALQKIIVDAPNFVRRKRQTSGLSAGCTHCWNNAQKFRARHDVLPAHLIFQRAGTAARLAICEPSISESCASQKTKMTTTEKQG
jgi:hypothetical protein